MKWLLLWVTVFSLLTIFELSKEYNQGHLPKKTYLIIGIMEGVTAVIAIALLFAL